MDQQQRKEFGLEIRAMRRGQNLSQEDLAKAAGVSVGTISNLENGKVELQAGNLSAVLDALNYRGRGERLWDDEVDAFLQMLGFRLAALAPDRRVELINQITRIAISGSPAHRS